MVWLNLLNRCKQPAASRAVVQESVLYVGSLAVAVKRKHIKHLHLRLVSPNASVQVSAPMRVSDAQICSMVLERLDWIKAKQAAFALRPQQLVCAYLTGETHYYLGKPYRLEVVEGKGKQHVVLIDQVLRMTVSACTTMEKRAQLMDAFYRSTLKAMMPILLDKWQPVMGVVAKDWGVKAMKTRWGTCNTYDKRIWLSLMLAKTAPDCIEYVLVHELVHLLERHHTPRFHHLMSQFLPDWPARKQLLNQSPSGELSV